MKQSYQMAGWARGANVYEVNIRQYTPEGNFAAFEQHLPRLRDMGVEILWLMPITPISLKERQGALGSYYACSSYTAINPEFGTLDDLKTLVAQAHQLGMKLIIDWVANHTGWDHHWAAEHPEWYVKDDKGNFTERNGWHDVIDLDYTSQAMRSAMIDAMKYWIQTCDIDGFRCDMAHLVPLDFWKEAKRQCEHLKHLYWLGECEQPAYHEVFNTSYAWSWMHASEQVQKEPDGLNEVRNVLHSYSQYPAGATKLFFTSNHDENSWNGTEYEKYGQTAQAWTVFSCTWPNGMPLIYSGQESPSKKRLKFFDKDLIEWRNPLQMEAFYQVLLHFRKENPAIREGETFILPSEHSNQLMCYLRKKANDVVLVLLNVSPDNKLKVAVQHEWLKGRFRNLFSQMAFHFNGQEEFEIQAGEYLVYERMH